MLQHEIDHLLWIYNRLIYVHGERPDADYMIKLKLILNGLKDEGYKNDTRED